MIADLKVELLAKTPNMEELALSAMKQCYSNGYAGDIYVGMLMCKTFDPKMLLSVMSSGHVSPIEHGSFTFAIAGVSRALTHQLVRHRLASYCLSGDSKIVSYNSVKSRSSRVRTIRELYEMSKNPKRNGPFSLIRIRSVDENGIIVSNKIVKVFKTGKKPVYKVTTVSGRCIKSTKEHRFKTKEGFVRLSELSVGDTVIVNGLPCYKNKEWLEDQYLNKNKTRDEIAELAGVSNPCIGNWVKRFKLVKPRSAYPNRKPGHGVPGMFSEKVKKKLSEQKLGSKNPAWLGDGASENAGRLRAQKMYPACECETCGAKTRFERHHIDGNTKNNDRSNILVLCSACHRSHHNLNGAVLAVHSDKIVSIEYVGEEETYDLEVGNPHNYVADGFVVHNSQQSQRYVDAKNVSYIMPPEIAKIPEARRLFESFMDTSALVYEDLQEILIKNGRRKTANEDARFVLPNACETRIVVTMNCRSLIHFFSLRCCKRAQWEIQAMANQMLEICKANAPTIFSSAGANCDLLGYCPEGERSCGKKKTLAELQGVKND